MPALSGRCAYRLGLERALTAVRTTAGVLPGDREHSVTDATTILLCEKIERSGQAGRPVTDLSQAGACPEKRASARPRREWELRKVSPRTVRREIDR